MMTSPGRSVERERRFAAYPKAARPGNDAELRRSALSMRPCVSTTYFFLATSVSCHHRPSLPAQRNVCG